MAARATQKSLTPEQEVRKALGDREFMFILVPLDVYRKISDMAMRKGLSVSQAMSQAMERFLTEDGNGARLIGEDSKKGHG